ncbi:MAG: hypothetical protein M1828_007166 [Chrysothrix sp. TS-e1954]|nr:MAG: hypothetical protein M1828_007166 [Chrysothrix sp. TS-e1954]
MSANNNSDPTKTPPTSKSKRNKKKKARSTAVVEAKSTNGVQHGEGTGEEDDQEGPDEDTAKVEDEDPTAAPEIPTHGRPQSDATQDKDEANQQDIDTQKRPRTNGAQHQADTNIEQHETDASDTQSRLDAAVKERDRLREEVTECRVSLEGIQQRHTDELGVVKSQLEETRTARDHSESKYQKLLGQVNTIKTQLGERLKADAAELSQARSQIETIEEENRVVKEDNESLQGRISEVTAEKEAQTKEVEEFRGRSNLSQQNWLKERDELTTRESHAREEFEAARQAMQDWEVLAMEERSVREGLGDRVAELEEQLSGQREAYERVTAEADGQSTTVDGLQRALQEIHEGRVYIATCVRFDADCGAARKQERRELVETSQAQLEDLRKQLRASEESSTSAQSALHSMQKDHERVLPFEKEVKEKNLIIGKQRHELVILNDHLTKALRFLKKGKPEDNVDRQLVTNHFLHFLALDRSDPKKFQILQLIAALLGWTDEQKEAAGLARPGASTSTNLRVPLSSPFHRVSSSASLNPINNVMASPSMTGSFNESVMSPSGSSKEGLAELWSDFLAREAEQGDGSKKSSRRGSTVSTPTLRNGMTSPATTDSPGTRNHRPAKLEGVDEDSASEAGNAPSERSTVG